VTRQWQPFQLWYKPFIEANMVGWGLHTSNLIIFKIFWIRFTKIFGISAAVIWLEHFLSLWDRALPWGHPIFAILIGTEYSEGSQSLRKIGILLHYRYVQNDICKTGMHPLPFRKVRLAHGWTKQPPWLHQRKALSRNLSFSPRSWKIIRRKFKKELAVHEYYFYDVFGRSVSTNSNQSSRLVCSRVFWLYRCLYATSQYWLVKLGPRGCQEGKNLV